MDEIELVIERLGIHGEGVARLLGFTVFVPGALPGERVRAQLFEKKKTYGRARVIQQLTSSSHRQKPICPLFGECGGCQLMHLEYTEQLKAKRERVQDALERIGKFKIEVLPCTASPSPLAYRNKIQLPVQGGHRLGLYAHNSHDFVEIKNCHIHCDLGEKVMHLIQEILTESPTPLKHVLIKTAESTEQALVIFVTTGEDFPRDVAKKLMQAMPEIRGVFQNINPATGNTILSADFRKLAGEESIEENLCGLRFKVSPASFFQVNPQQAEKLYQKVLEFAALTGSETVLDAYCGVGTLSLLLAKHAKEVIGVEASLQAIQDANKNAALNGIHADFVCAPVEEFIAKTSTKIDLAILNPPRKGCVPSVLSNLVEIAPQRIIYVSCDPATLARDLQILSIRGYALHTVQPFDMFPQTAHVESVALLKKTN